MKELGVVLNKKVSEITAQQNGQTSPALSSDGAKAELMRRLNTLLITGNQQQGQRPSNAIGSPHGGTGAEEIDPAIPAKLAEECTAQRLPLSVKSWIENTETWHKSRFLGDEPRVGKPALSDIQAAEKELAVLEQILTPSKARGDQLVKEIVGLLSIYPFGLRHDQGMNQLRIEEWCDALEGYPLYAIKRAKKWNVCGSKKEPSLAEFLDDVKLATGRDVVSRRKRLQEWVMAAREAKQSTLESLESDGA